MKIGPRLHWFLVAAAVLLAPPAILVGLIATREWQSYGPALAFCAAYIFIVFKLWSKGGDAGRAWRWIARPALVLIFPAWGVAAILAAVAVISPGADLADPVRQRAYLSKTLKLDFPTQATPLFARDGRIADDRLSMVVLDADPRLIDRWFKTLPQGARATARPEPAAADRTSFNWLLPCGEAMPAAGEISARAHEALAAFCAPDRRDPKARLVELQDFDHVDRDAFIVLSPGRRAILILLNDY